MPEGGVSSYEVAAGTLQYLSPQRAGSGYEALGNLWVSGLLAVQSQAVMNVRGPLSVEVGGRLSNRGLIEAFQGLRNQGRIENRDDGVLMVHGSAGLLNEGVLVNSGRLNADGRLPNAAGARFEHHHPVRGRQQLRAHRDRPWRPHGGPAVPAVQRHRRHPRGW